MATPGRPVSADVLRRIAKLAKEKRTQLEIADACGISVPTVKKHFPAGVEPLPRGRPSGRRTT